AVGRRDRVVDRCVEPCLHGGGRHANRRRIGWLRRVGGQNQACSGGLIGLFRPVGPPEQGDDVVHREIGQLGKPETSLTGKPEIIGRGDFSKRPPALLPILRGGGGRPQVDNRNQDGVRTGLPAAQRTEGTATLGRSLSRLPDDRRKRTPTVPGDSPYAQEFGALARALIGAGGIAIRPRIGRVR